MPIRFRCAYCNQLMGIARRKAGTVVRCPTCGGQVIVPPEEPPARAPGKPEKKKAAAGAGAVFERSDFEKVFEAGEGTAAAGPEASFSGATSRATESEEAQEVDVEPVALGASGLNIGLPPQRGVFLTPVKMTLLSLLMVLLVGLAFLAGVLVGRSS